MWTIIVSGPEVRQNVHVPKVAHVSHVTLYDFPHRPFETFYYLCFHILFHREMVNRLLIQELSNVVIVEFFPFVHLQLERSSHVIEHPDQCILDSVTSLVLDGNEHCIPRKHVDNAQ